MENLTTDYIKLKSFQSIEAKEGIIQTENVNLLLDDFNLIIGDNAQESLKLG